jgi:long-chain acyl-CoA synthetase
LQGNGFTVSAYQGAQAATVMLIYTSGSTGKPKGVMLDHANIDAMTASFVDHMELTARDHSLLILPLFHVNALMLSTLSPFRVGAQASIVGRFSVSRFFEQVERLRPTFFSAVPSILSMLVALPDDVKADTTSLRFAGCGAAPLSEELMTRARERLGIVSVEGYGLTEASCASAVNPRNGSSGAQRISTSTAWPTPHSRSQWRIRDSLR